MHDPEEMHDAILGDHVVHHPVVADTQAVERIRGALDRPHPLAADAPRRRGGSRKPLETLPDPRLSR